MGITTSTNGPTYAKIIGDNYGSYPYRVGLNTLAHNGETFNPLPECGRGGLYFCKLKYIHNWMEYGDTLCIVKPVGRVIKVENKFKTNKLEIVEMMNLREVRTWEFLIEHGVDIHANGECALRWAAKNGSLEVVEFLVIKHNAYVRARGDYALRKAVENGHLEIVKFLVEHNRDIFKDLNTMRWIAENCSAETKQYILRACKK